MIIDQLIKKSSSLGVARPIQVNKEIEEFCRKEIQDFLNKKINQKKQFSLELLQVLCDKNEELERGMPRLVVNYKPLNLFY